MDLQRRSFLKAIFGAPVILPSLFHSAPESEPEVREVESVQPDQSINWSDNGTAPWCGHASDKLYLQTGQFSTVMKTI